MPHGLPSGPSGAARRRPRAAAPARVAPRPRPRRLREGSWEADGAAAVRQAGRRPRAAPPGERPGPLVLCDGPAGLYTCGGAAGRGVRGQRRRLGLSVLDVGRGVGRDVLAVLGVGRVENGRVDEVCRGPCEEGEGSHGSGSGDATKEAALGHGLGRAAGLGRRPGGRRGGRAGLSDSGDGVARAWWEGQGLGFGAYWG